MSTKRIPGYKPTPGRHRHRAVNLIGRAARLAVPAAIACLFLAPLLGTSAVSAQQSAASLSVQSVDASQYPAITATVSVLDAAGVPIAGLDAGHFSASDGGQPVSVAAVTHAEDGSVPLSVVLVIDTSGSMQGAPLARAKEAASAFVSALQPNDRAAIVAFSDDVRTPIAAFTGDREALNAAIGGLEANGATVLYRAVQAAVLVAMQSGGGRRAIVLMTDGQNDTGASDATREASLAAAGNAGVPVFTIGLGDQPDVAYLQALADATRGIYNPANTANIAEVYSGIARLLRGQYVLTLQDPRDADGASGTVSLSADTPGGTATAQVSFVRGAAPVTAPTTAPTAPAVGPTSGTSSTGGSSRGWLIAVPVALVAAVAVVGTVLFARRRRRRGQLRGGGQVDEPLPAPPGPAMSGPGDDASRGRILEIGAPGGREFEFQNAPLRIGSAPACDARLERHPEVAPQHALIWAREGKIMLRHVGGPRRKTMVNAKPIDWIILDDGDEFAIGPHRFRVQSLVTTSSN